MLPLCAELVSLFSEDTEIRKEMLQAQKNIVAFMAHLNTEKKERHFKLRKLI